MRKGVKAIVAIALLVSAFQLDATSLTLGMRLSPSTGSRSAGEGPGHTARVYVTEESHCGIVPMNHSNKDGTLVGGEWGGKAADQGGHFSI